MLGAEHLASFQSPNVIDGGDEAPMPPPRKQPQKTNATSRVAPKGSLGRTQKIQLEGSGGYRQVRHSPERLLNDIGDLDLEKAHSQEYNQQPPSIDEARTYAASLLADVNSRAYTFESLEEPSNGMSTNSVLYEPYNASSTNESSKHLVRNRLVSVALKGAIGVLALVLVILILSRL